MIRVPRFRVLRAWRQLWPTLAAKVGWGWLFPALLAVVPLGTAWVLGAAQQYDDQYITYTYARNLAEGNGFTYNGDQPLVGTTTPGLTLLLAGLCRLLPGVSFPTLSHAISALCASATVLLVYRLGQQEGCGAAGLAMAALLAFDPLFPWIMGSEYPLLLMLCILSFVLVLSRRYDAAAVTAALALITRYDAAIFIGILALLVLWQEGRILWRPLSLLALILSAWLLYAYFTFGSVLPATLAVKQAHRSLQAWPRIDEGFLAWLGYLQRFRQLVSFLSVMLAFGLVGMAIRRMVWLLPLIAWGILYVLVYLEVGVTFYFWYFVPAWFTLMLSASGGLAVLSGWHLGRPGGTWWQQAGSWGMRMVVAMALMATVGFAADQYRGAISSHQDPTQSALGNLYTDTGLWLEKNTPPGSPVAFIEVGYVGFYSRRPFVDLLGLVTPGITPYLEKQDFVGILSHFEPEYYLRNTAYDGWGMTQHIKTEWFQDHYVPIHRVKHDSYPGAVVIYRRRLDFDFYRHLDEARIEAPLQPFPHFEQAIFTINGDTRQVLMLYPPARVSYTVHLSQLASLLFTSLAMDPETWDGGGDGATFIVEISNAGQRERVLEMHIGVGAEDRRWHDVAIDVRHYQGQTVEIAFSVSPGSANDFTADRAGWATPVILRETR